MNPLRVLLISLGLLSLIAIRPAMAQADPSAQRLGRCMIDSLNGRERKALAKWIYFSMSVHPEIQAYSKVTPQAIEDSHKTIGRLVTRLLTRDCREQAKQALASNSAATMSSAFELVGRVAMQELMNDPGVARALSGFDSYLDKQALQELADRP